jgi:hypothetical protein
MALHDGSLRTRACGAGSEKVSPHMANGFKEDSASGPDTQPRLR